MNSVAGPQEPGGQGGGIATPPHILAWISKLSPSKSWDYSLISTKQLHIFSINPKLDMQLFVDFCVFTRFWLNLSDRNLKLFWTSKQNNFRFRSSKFSQKRVKTQKSTNNRMSSFGLIEKNMELSHIFLAVIKIL